MHAMDSFHRLLFIIFIALALITLTFGMYIFNIIREELCLSEGFAAILWGICTLIFLINALVAACTSPIKTVTYVEATIDKEYPFYLLEEKYEVVEHRGEIYLLKEKEE